MKIGILVESLPLPLFEGVEKAARLGVDGIQIHATAGADPVKDFSPAKLKELKERCEQVGLEISAVCGDLPGYGFERAEDNPARIEQTRRLLDIVAALGSPVMTCHIGVVPSDRNSAQYEAMRSALATLGNDALERNVVVAIETGPEPSAVLRQFILDTGSAGVRVNLDPANLLMVLNENPVEAVANLKDFIVHTHAKDGVHYQKCDPVKVYHAFAEGGFEKLLQETGQLFAETPLGAGGIDWKAYLEALRGARYDGYLTIERETGADPVADITTAITFLKRAIAR